MHSVIPMDQVALAPPGRLPFRSEACTESHFFLDHFRYWCNEISERPRFHRKLWEFVYILQALWERGLLVSGTKGLGFGVGLEPLVGYFAAKGCQILATDLEIERATQLGWTNTNQRSRNFMELNSRGLCDPELFSSLVSYRDVDMNDFPPGLIGFDFCWSACSLEHLGSIKNGIDFVMRSIETLAPGGWAVHTTELNLTSNRRTLDNQPTVIFRRKDLEDLIATLESRGHYVEPLLIQNGSQVDRYVDVAPYCEEPHLRLRLDRFTSTSVGLIIRRCNE